MKKQTTHKMDQHLIATGQKYEIDHVIRKFKLIGIPVTSSQVKAAAKKCNNSRQKTYNLLVKKYHNGK